MSKNEVFGPQSGPAPNFLRNTYDKQYQNLITTDFGELRPCFIKDVLPGTSVHIDPMVAIRSHPIVFPINTRIKFYCHFFYGRNRILYKDFEDFIFNTREGLTPPLLKLTPERAKMMISTNSLGDNLGVPSTYASDTPISSSSPFVPINNQTLCSLGISGSGARLAFDFSYITSRFVVASRDGLPILKTEATQSGYFNIISFGYYSDLISSPFTSGVLRTSNITSNISVIPESSKVFCCLLSRRSSDADNTFRFGSLPFECELIVHTGNDPLDHYIEFKLSDVDLQSLLDSSNEIIERGDSYVFYYGTYDSEEYGTSGYYSPKYTSPFFPYAPTSADLVPVNFVYNYIESGQVDATDDSVLQFNKFAGDNPVIPLSSLPFRLYEFCCNYYYRNDQNNPYILDGVPQYNKFIPTDAGGWDTNEYLIHHRNWESDPFTTAVPSPQYGTAPLVGLTYSGGDTARVLTNVTDSDGNTKQLGITVGVAEDGTLSSVMQVDTGVPSGSLRRLMDGVDGISLGMSINDLRNVNSFQRFLENVIRRGLRYRNQLLSHFGVSVDYPDIDIPQFIGGFSGDLTVMEVTNMSESADVALGDVAGKINAVLKSNHTISCYCPEHGWIIGIFSIVPVPTYSQILPTFFTRYSYLDYFQKEFDKIGYVPIFHRNFLPLQSDDPNRILGYQRAWWDYMCSFDEVHGDFRTSLSDFVLYRRFKEVPTLNESFLKVDSESLNNIFAVDKVDEKYKNSKKFMCQFYFEFPEKNMVSKFGVASLE